MASIHSSHHCRMICDAFERVDRPVDVDDKHGAEAPFKIDDAIRKADEIICQIEKEGTLASQGLRRLKVYVNGLRHDFQSGVELDIEIIRKVGFENVFRWAEKKDDPMQEYLLLRGSRALVMSATLSPKDTPEDLRQKLMKDRRSVHCSYSGKIILTQTCVFPKNYSKFAQILLQAGADPNLYTECGAEFSTSHHPLAETFGNTHDEPSMRAASIKQLVGLLAYGADPNVQYRVCPLAFHINAYGVSRVKCELLPLLVIGGMNINAAMKFTSEYRIYHGSTVLANTCARRLDRDPLAPLAIKTLLYLGAEVTSEARTLAAANGHTRELERAEEIRRKVTADHTYPNEDAIAQLYSRINEEFAPQPPASPSTPPLPLPIFSLVINYAGVHPTIIRANYDACMALDAQTPQPIQGFFSGLARLSARALAIFG